MTQTERRQNINPTTRHFLSIFISFFMSGCWSVDLSDRLMPADLLDPDANSPLPTDPVDDGTTPVAGIPQSKTFATTTGGSIRLIKIATIARPTNTHFLAVKADETGSLFIYASSDGWRSIYKVTSGGGLDLACSINSDRDFGVAFELDANFFYLFNYVGSQTNAIRRFDRETCIEETALPINALLANDFFQSLSIDNNGHFYWATNGNFSIFNPETGLSLPWTASRTIQGETATLWSSVSIREGQGWQLTSSSGSDTKTLLWKIQAPSNPMGWAALAQASDRQYEDLIWASGNYRASIAVISASQIAVTVFENSFGQALDSIRLYFFDVSGF